MTPLSRSLRAQAKPAMLISESFQNLCREVFFPHYPEFPGCRWSLKGQHARAAMSSHDGCQNIITAVHLLQFYCDFMIF